MLPLGVGAAEALLRRAQRSQEPAEPAAAGQGSDPKAPLSTGGRTAAATPPRLAWVANKLAQPSAGRRAGGCLQRWAVPRAAPGSSQPRPIRR
eukprot:scaffold97655_cov63-Phaeocystis_antarctica.AAC.5